MHKPPRGQATGYSSSEDTEKETTMWQKHSTEPKHGMYESLPPPFRLGPNNPVLLNNNPLTR
jgi:hypothetical protein